MKRIVVVGGGPAGFMAAIAASSEAAEREVLLYEADVALEKLLRTGGGRCNLTNATEDPRVMARSYPRGGRFLISGLSRFGVRETMAWFRDRGLALVVEDHGRVFPASGRATDVRDVLAAAAKERHVAVHQKTAVTRIRRGDNGFVVETPRAGEPADAVVIATGGDWRDGPHSGYALARSLGHTVTPLAPSLCGLICAEAWCRRLAGLTLADARLRDGAMDERGELLFTHRGISGPLAFCISSRSAFLPMRREDPLVLELSALPEDTRESAEARLVQSLSSRPKQSVRNALRALLPASLADVFLKLAGVEADVQCSQLPKAGRRKLAELCVELPVTVVAREKGGEMVTAGGVALEEVNSKTMESRRVPGLFFCGEVLDVDGFTGGFNLQAAWTTGYLAGRGAQATEG